MKKLAIIAALTLAIGASMTAGTMARYNQDLGSKQATISTKQFQIGAEDFKDISFNVKPGDIETQTISLDTSKVETDMTLSLEVRNIDKELMKDLKEAGVSFKITNDVTKNEEELKDMPEGKYLHIEVPANTPKVTYTISLEWKGNKDISSELTKKVQGKTTDMSVRIIGTQK